MRAAKAGRWTPAARLLRERLRSALNEDARVRLLWGILCFTLLGMLFFSALAAGGLDLSVGQVAPRDITAPRDFLDRPTTERLRREAADRVEPLYRQDPRVAVEVDRALAEAFSLLRAIRGASGMEPAQKAESLKRSLGLALPSDAAEAALRAGGAVVDAMEADLRGILAQVLSQPVRPAELPASRREAVAEVRSLNYPRPLSDFLAALVESRLRPNDFLDEEGTRQRRAAAMESVTPVMVLKGEILVRRGERVEADDLVRLQDAGVLGRGAGGWRVAGAFLLAALFVAAVAAVLFKFKPEVYAGTPRLLLFGLVTLGAALLGKGLWALSPFLVPVAGAGMLLAVLLDPMVALLAAVILSLVAGLFAGFALEPVIVAFLGGLAGIFAVAGATHRSHILRAGFIAALVQAAAVAALALAAGDLDRTALARDVLAAVANGFLLSGVLTAGSLSSFENLFGILTPLRLLELADPNQPLLRRLLLEAPGTYHHSLLVANLAEAAAEAVGANGLLARVGAYYHDVGKIKRPYFFVENQFGGRNPHDRLSPHLSALIITSHVKEGIELARQYRLPEELVRFIPEHHGTSLLGFFYHRALTAGDGEADESGFRHAGPLPRSRETAIVMLADASEAVVRTLARPTPGRVQAAVRRVIRERLNDGQLDGCPLTLKDLNTIAEAFVRVLAGVYHARIEYPEPLPQNQNRGGRADGGLVDRKPGVRRRRSAG